MPTRVLPNNLEAEESVLGASNHVIIVGKK